VATYLYYLLLARPNFLITQGLLTTNSKVIFLVRIGGRGIQQLKVKWGNKNLHKVIYASIYHLYNLSHFADPLYMRTGFNKETSEATYTVKFSKEDYPSLCTIYARNPFTTHTHVLFNLSLTQGDDRPPMVLKEQLCQTRQCFNELEILTKIYQPMNVPGVVEAIDSECIVAPLSPKREKHCLGLWQTASPFTSICMAKKMLEMLFNLLEGI
jgi:hypothetical protein